MNKPEELRPPVDDKCSCGCMVCNGLHWLCTTGRCDWVDPSSLTHTEEPVTKTFNYRISNGGEFDPKHTFKAEQHYYRGDGVKLCDVCMQPESAHTEEKPE